jgi:hypothetical protein
MQFFSIQANNTGGRIAVAIGIPVALMLDWIVLDGIVWQSRAAEFPKATATITHSEIEVRQGSKGGKRYVLNVRFEFTVGGQKFTGTRLRYYPDDGSSRSAVEEPRSRYPVGVAVTAYYPPSDPTLAILHPGVEGTDCLRALFAIGLTLLVVGAMVLVFGKRFGFDPSDPDCVRQTDNGWEAQMPYTSHAGVFAMALAGCSMFGSFLLLAIRGPNPPPQLAGAALAASLAIASAGSVIFSRYPTLAADLDAKDLVLPAPWFGDPVRVPFDQIGTIAVREQEKSAGRGHKYLVYNCEIGWGSSSGVQITTVATFLDRIEAEKLTAWVNVTLGRLEAEIDGPGSVFRA